MFRSILKRRMVAAGFTLVEIMVTMALLSVIVLGLMAMFNQTQRAFRAGMAQTDYLEGGRMFSDLLVRDLGEITPTGQTNGVNFFAQIPANYTPGQMALPGGSNFLRTNILQDIFFMARQNQYWNGIGYFVRTNASYYGNVNLVGTLYRFETNVHTVDFNGNGYLPFLTFEDATNNFSISKVLDGVVEFHVRCYDDRGLLITNGSLISTNQFVRITNSTLIAPGEVQFYGFSNNVTPAAVEVEVGVLEPALLKRMISIPNAVGQANFLSSHVGNVHVFRQRIPIRNVDPSAYPQP